MEIPHLNRDSNCRLECLRPIVRRRMPLTFICRCRVRNHSSELRNVSVRIAVGFQRILKFMTTRIKQITGTLVWGARDYLRHDIGNESDSERDNIIY